MKVLHIITGLADGGAEAVLFRLITHDTKNQHAVVSLTTEGKYGPALRDRGVPVVALEMPRGRLRNLCTTPPTRSWRRVQGQYRFVGWDRNRC